MTAQKDLIYKLTTEAIASAIAPLQQTLEEQQQQIDQLRTGLTLSSDEVRVASEAAVARREAAAARRATKKGEQLPQLVNPRRTTCLKHVNVTMRGVVSTPH